MNKSCVMKLAWGLKTDTGRLWFQVLDGKYERGSLASGNIQVKASDSSLWKAIHGCWQEVNDVEAWALGNGNNINL